MVDMVRRGELELDLDEVAELAAEIARGLTGRTRETQGAVIGYLLATFVAGHGVVGDPGKTEGVRGMALAMTVQLAGRLVPIVAAANPEIVEKLRGGPLH